MYLCIRTAGRNSTGNSPSPPVCVSQLEKVFTCQEVAKGPAPASPQRPASSAFPNLPSRWRFSRKKPRHRHPPPPPPAWAAGSARASFPLTCPGHVPLPGGGKETVLGGAGGGAHPGAMAEAAAAAGASSAPAGESVGRHSPSKEGALCGE